MDILIDSVSREIFDISVRERFRRNMFQRLGDLRN
jgi:hypothetical protein